jgi:hypothetical protein
MRLPALALLVCLGGRLGAAEPQAFVIDATGVRPADAAQPDARAAADATNRVENGGFDVSERLRAWSSYTPPYSVGTGRATWTNEDAGQAHGSGSLSLTNSSPADGPREFGVQQCLRPARPLVGADRPFPTHFWLRVPPGQVVGDHSFALVSTILFTSTDCTTGFLGGGGMATHLTPGGTSGWQEINPGWFGGSEFLEPGGSLLLSVTLLKSEGVGDPVQVYFDDVGVRGSWEAAKGDLNHDGETDLVLHNHRSGETELWLMRDEQRLGAPVVLEPAPASPHWQVAGVDDFDGDGLQDLLMWNNTTGETEFWLMNGTTRVGAPVPLAHAPPLPWKPVATADFNGDGQADILYREDTLDPIAKQRLRIWTLKGLSHSDTLTPKPDFAENSNWYVAAARDMDGDGQTDLLWFNRDSGRVVYWLLDGAARRRLGSFAKPDRAGNPDWKLVAAGDYGLGPAGERPAVADSIDLVWRNALTGRMAIWFMDRRMNRTGGRMIVPDPPAAQPGWTVAGPR